MLHGEFHVSLGCRVRPCFYFVLLKSETIRIHDRCDSNDICMSSHSPEIKPGNNQMVTKMVL